MLFFKKKLNWGYMRFWAFILSLLLLSTYSSAFEAPQHKLNFHLGAGGLVSTNVFYSRGAFGVSYDFVNKKGHSIALDAHFLSDRGMLYNIGYRHHNNNGLYVGVGIAEVSREIGNTLCSDRLGREVRCKTSLKNIGLGLSFGYTHIFDSGFTLGVSSIYVPLGQAEIVAEADSPFGGSSSFDSGLDLGIRSIGLVLGRTWR